MRPVFCNAYLGAHLASHLCNRVRFCLRAPCFWPDTSYLVQLSKSRTPLHRAASYGSRSAVETLLSDPRVNVNAQDEVRDLGGDVQ